MKTRIFVLQLLVLVASSNRAVAGPISTNIASFLLPAGAHSITIAAHEAQIQGEGFFIVEPVREPSSLTLFAAGLVGLVETIRRRRLRS